MSFGGAGSGGMIGAGQIERGRGWGIIAVVSVQASRGRESADVQFVALRVATASMQHRCRQVVSREAAKKGV
jgi:hypothetical protein